MTVEATTSQVLPNGTKQLVEFMRLDCASELEAISRYLRVTNYLAAAQIYLKDNFLLEEPLRPEHIKDRLLGHWGTSPGINLMYAHLNHLIIRYDLDMLLVTGPGHGAAANLANLYLEGTLQEFYPELTLDRAGLNNFIKRFSWPGGFPSHLYPGVPGTIHEGGELGYALATAFGAAMDNPDLIVACIVGDGEAETGPTAAAWHSYKYLDPAVSGAVLPIVHVNGYKIANPTIYGAMSNEELLHLFTGYGYQVCFAEGENASADLYRGIDWAYQEIRRIQQAARSGQPVVRPLWPVILLRTPKGMTGIKEINGVPIENTHRSHQVPASEAITNPEHLRLLEEWLHSYHIEEFFDVQGRPIEAILNQCPVGERRMGANPHTFGGQVRQNLDQPDLFSFEVSNGGGTGGNPRTGNLVSNTAQVGKYLKEIVRRNPQIFRIFSPDELESNKLSAVLDVTDRCFQWSTESESHHQSSQVLEILSEHTLQGWLQGYLLSGRHGIFPSYEAFLTIVVSMMDQYAKFLKMSRDLPWRLPVPSLNYLETSTLWRQEHNGFSHQSPGFINDVLNRKAQVSRVYLPPDANCLLYTIHYCLRSKEYVNLIIANKQPMPQWLSMEEAVSHCRAGASVWQWASTDEGVDPDVVLVGIGDCPTLEVMAAAHILRTEMPDLRLRVVNVTDLMVLEKDTTHPHGLDTEMFEALFTADRPVIVNFHGYPSAVKQLLFERHHTERFQINGYQEEGTTTTPFDMSVRNKTSRYHIIMQAIYLAARRNARVATRAIERVHHYEHVLTTFQDYIQKNGVDPEEISNWKWS